MRYLINPKLSGRSSGVERNLAKVEVEGSDPSPLQRPSKPIFLYCIVAEKVSGDT